MSKDKPESDDNSFANNPFATLKGLKSRLPEKAAPTPSPAPRRKPEQPIAQKRADRPGERGDSSAATEPGTPFAAVMQDVVPLGDRDYRAVRKQTETASAKPHREDEEVRVELDRIVTGAGLFDMRYSDEAVEGIANGVDRRTLKKLRKGDFSIGSHLDLHGYNRQDAKQIVSKFIEAQRATCARCVLIVHGRGLNSKDQVPVLKEALAIWLTRGRIAKSVLAFCTARPCDGGLGAVYVLLRKQR